MRALVETSRAHRQKARLFRPSCGSNLPFYQAQTMDINSQFNTARAQYEQGNFKAAEKSFKGILQTKKGYIPACYGLALCFVAQEDFEAALDVLSEGITEILRGSEPLNTNHLLLWEVRAQVYMEVGDYTNAIYDYRLILLKQPDNTQAAKFLAFALIEDRKISEALQELTKLVDRSSQDAEAHLLRAEALLALERMNEAQQEVEIAKKLAQAQPNMANVLSRIQRLSQQIPPGSDREGG